MLVRHFQRVPCPPLRKNIDNNGFVCVLFIQGVSDISAVIVTEDYLGFQMSLGLFYFVFNELFTFETSDEWQH